MPRPGDDLRDAMRWLKYARANVFQADVGRAGGVLIEYLCFEAQQAVEKALKAVLIVRGAGVPRTHNIEILLAALQNEGVEPPDRSRLRRCSARSLFKPAIRPLMNRSTTTTWNKPSRWPAPSLTGPLRSSNRAPRRSRPSLETVILDSFGATLSLASERLVVLGPKPRRDAVDTDQLRLPFEWPRDPTKLRVLTTSSEKTPLPKPR